MKKFKKLLCIVLVVCLFVASLSACTGGSETSNNDEKLKIFVTMKNRPDCELVSKELSKITREKLGFDVEFMFGYGQDKIELMLASNEQMDIGFDNSANFVSRVRSGAYVDITEKLKNEYKDLYNAIPEDLWEGSQVDGKNYAVPTYKEFGEQWVLMADKEVISKYNIDVTKINELKDVEPILEALKKEGRAGFEILSSATTHMNLVLKDKYDIVTGHFVVKRDEPDKILHFMETEEYRDFVNMMHDWYAKGYIAKDITTRTDYESYHSTGKTGLVYISYNPYAENILNDAYGADLQPIPVTPIVKTNTSMMGSLYGIYAKSKNVDKALAFLQLWNTDPTVKNMITYGIEGRHYDLVDGKVRRREGALDLYKLDNSISGNIMISHLLEEDPDDKYDKFIEFNEAAISAPVLGFYPDTSSIEGKLAACTNAASEYNPLLCCGVLEPEKNIDKMLKALKNSGVKEVKAELQKQYDNWRKK